MIADMIVWIQSFETAPAVWYPKAFVTKGKQAMSHAEWWPAGPRAWGIAEHVTSPDASTHWDCGAINSAEIMRLVDGASEESLEHVSRIAGNDRYETAALAAKKAWPTAIKAYIASGENFPDALSYQFSDGPLLLVRKNEVPFSTRDALMLMGVRKIEIIGGSAAVSAAVARRLNELVSAP